MMLSLVGNPSTGAWWHIESLDSAVLHHVCEAFASFQPELVGSPGLIHGFYQAAQLGQTELHLLNYRVWLGPGTATDSFTVTVFVH
jgi:predicted secreted protein